MATTTNRSALAPMDFTSEFLNQNNSVSSQNIRQKNSFPVRAAGGRLPGPAPAACDGCLIRRSTKMLLPAPVRPAMVACPLARKYPQC